MGLAMARNVMKGGHRVTGYDPLDAALTRLAEAGGRAAASPAAVGAESEIVVVMVPNDNDVRGSVLGPNGIAAGLPAGGQVLVMSTISPTCTQEVGAAVIERGLAYLEAPVTRSSQHAIDGELGILAGGSADDLKRARPILDLMGSDIIHCGPIGAGAAMKLVNNMLAGTIGAAVAESFVLGAKAGLTMDTMLSVLTGTAANCAALAGISGPSIWGAPSSPDSRSPYSTRTCAWPRPGHRKSAPSLRWARAATTCFRSRWPAATATWIRVPT